MKIFQQLINSPSQWIKEEGPEANIVFSSRVRLARNIQGFVFPPWASNSELKKVSTEILEAAGKSKYFKVSSVIDMEKLSFLERRFLLERHLISDEFVDNGKYRFLVATEGEIISLMINEEDHLRLQSILPGLQLMEAWKLSDKVDNDLEEYLNYAFSPQRGYLTSCPTNVGTGMRASCMIHLPSLVATNRIRDVLKGVSQLGLITRGLYGEGTSSRGDFFQISNQVTLGLKEEQILNSVERVTRRVVEEEKRAREVLLKNNSAKIKDEIGRAYGILTNAYLISSEEALQLLSKIRLGIGLGFLSGLKIGILNELFILIEPAQIQIMEGKSLNPFSRDRTRAKIIKEKLTIHPPGQMHGCMDV
ncbi:protein arginine kinase [Candidatus Aerophobetes bacterium]|nr:protein arginine kinase [Candidatus Aerophobetes bacterium]